MKVHLAASWRVLELAGGLEGGEAHLAEWTALAAEQLVPGTPFRTVPGIYGWKEIDTGSRLLAESLPEGLRGDGLDLGCGYGYLSYEALRRSPGVTALTLLDFDWRALECARHNLATFPITQQFTWADIHCFQPAPQYDWVLLNPPFHSGRKVDMALGRAFVSAAAQSLRASGVLHLVGNSFLPYGELLRTLFAQVEKVRAAEGFTVYHAGRPMAAAF